MQIQTVCPQCGKRYNIDEKYDGAAVQCENCGRQFLAARMLDKRGIKSKGKLSFGSRILIWLLFFAIQGIGYLFAMVINMGIDALKILFMVDESISFDVLKVSILVILTAAVSYEAFSSIVVKMIAKRFRVE